jgi:hypothetical protein
MLLPRDAVTMTTDCPSAGSDKDSASDVMFFLYFERRFIPDMVVPGCVQSVSALDKL